MGKLGLWCFATVRSFWIFDFNFESRISGFFCNLFSSCEVILELPVQSFVWSRISDSLKLFSSYELTNIIKLQISDFLKIFSSCIYFSSHEVLTFSSFFLEL